MSAARKRVRELGITPGVLPVGRSNVITDVPEVPNDQVSPLFQAASEAAEEAIYNSLRMAETMTGYCRAKVAALPLSFSESQ